MTGRPDPDPARTRSAGPLRIHLIHQGFGDYVDGLVGGLAGLGVAAVELRVTSIISGPAPRSRLRTDGVDGRGGVVNRTVVVPRFRDPRSAIGAPRAVTEALAHPVDLVHWQAAGNPWVDLAFLRWLGRRRRRPGVVVTVHDMQPHPGDRSGLPGTFPVIRSLVRRADRVIVHASHVRAQAIGAGAAPDAVRVLAHGELATRYLPPTELPLEPSDEPTVLFFGRAQGYKGLDVVAAAMPAIVASRPDARLVVAGAGPAVDDVFPPGRPLPPWCELHRGPVPDDRVVGLFRRASLVVLPYREASQSGVAALAAGMGRPVVASRVPGLDEIVEDGVSGRLVDPGSPGALGRAIVALLDDGPERRRLGAGAHAAARGRLSWSTIAERQLDLYHEAVHRDVCGGGGTVVGAPRAVDGEPHRELS